jgi:hypothetical protein
LTWFVFSTGLVWTVSWTGAWGWTVDTHYSKFWTRCKTSICTSYICSEQIRSFKDRFGEYGIKLGQWRVSFLILNLTTLWLQQWCLFIPFISRVKLVPLKWNLYVMFWAGDALQVSLLLVLTSQLSNEWLEWKNLV